MKSKLALGAKAVRREADRRGRSGAPVRNVRIQSANTLPSSSSSSALLVRLNKPIKNTESSTLTINDYLEKRERETKRKRVPLVPAVGAFLRTEKCLKSERIK